MNIIEHRPNGAGQPSDRLLAIVILLNEFVVKTFSTAPNGLLAVKSFIGVANFVLITMCKQLTNRS